MSIPGFGLGGISPLAIFSLLFDGNILLTLWEHLENIGLLLLFAGTAAALLWFVYWVFLRRLLRVWRIARIRSRRLLIEASTRGRR